MTRKHFEKIAGVLKYRAKAIDNSSEATDEQKQYALYHLRYTMYHLADEFEDINPSFDRSRFFKASLVPPILEKYLRILN